MSPGVKTILAILLGLAASGLARFSNGPSPVETYTSGFIYWLNHYSGFYFGIPIAGIVWLVTGGGSLIAKTAVTETAITQWVFRSCTGWQTWAIALRNVRL